MKKGEVDVTDTGPMMDTELDPGGAVVVEGANDGGSTDAELEVLLGIADVMLVDVVVVVEAEVLVVPPDTLVRTTGNGANGTVTSIEVVMVPSSSSWMHTASVPVTVHAAASVNVSVINGSGIFAVSTMSPAPSTRVTIKNINSMIC